MDRIRFVVPALLVVLALLFVPACGGDEEPEKPDVPETPEKSAEKPDMPEKQPEKPAEPEKPAGPKVLGMDVESLTTYLALLTDLKSTSPNKFKDLGSDAAALAAGLGGMEFGKKAQAVLDKYGISAEAFATFSQRLWTAVAAATAGDAVKGLEGMGVTGLDSVKGALDNVSAEDKKFAKDNMDTIQKAME